MSHVLGVPGESPLESPLRGEMIKVYIIESSNAAAIAAAGDGSQSRLQVERDGSEWFLGVLVVFFFFPFFRLCFCVPIKLRSFPHLFVNTLSDSLL